MAKLTFVLEDGQEVVVPLAEHITLGREEDNDVVIDDDRVSKHHAELVRNADGTIQLFDSNSTAGTFVNGERVRSHTILHGDQLAFGPLTAILDLEENGANGNTIIRTPAGADTQALTSGKPVKASKIGTRKKSKGGHRGFPGDPKTAPPPEEFLARQQSENREAARLEMEKARLQAELDAMQKALGDWQQRAESERSLHHSRVEALRAEEARLAPIKAAVDEAEAAHAEWLRSVQALTTQHAEQSAALQRVAKDEAAARHELEGLATHRDQALAHLQQIRAEAVHAEIALDDLRRQVADLEARSQHVKEVTEVREDQLKTAEKKLEQLSQQRTQLEARVHELLGTEEKLAQTTAHCREAEAKQATLTASIAALGVEQQRSESIVKDLAARIAALNESHQRDTAATAAALASRQQAEESLRHIQDKLAACEKHLSTETQRLQDATARRTELDRQCQELADTGQKLANVKQQLATATQQLAEARTSIASSEAQITAQTSSIKTLAADETATKGRIEVLHARENDLRAELTQLSAAERSQRNRFEEVRELAAEAEKEHTAQQQQLTGSLEATRDELHDLVSRLTPLRDWKEAMDLLYARLATLPQDSEEARHLWHEIEKEKAGLHELITTARTQAQAAALPAASHTHALSQIVAGKAESPRAATTRVTGPVAAATAQETTLRSRLGHLRESVQREESRLEQLRLERTRHEVPHRASPAADAMMREQSRHLETKIRQEQERHHALLRHIELAQAEEDKRRERLGELEHKLAELRTEITEAERLRSELRQQADLAHTELKNYEAALDRVTKKTSE